MSETRIVVAYAELMTTSFSRCGESATSPRVGPRESADEVATIGALDGMTLLVLRVALAPDRSLPEARRTAPVVITAIRPPAQANR